MQQPDPLNQLRADKRQLERDIETMDARRLALEAKSNKGFDDHRELKGLPEKIQGAREQLARKEADLTTLLKSQQQGPFLNRRFLKLRCAPATNRLPPCRRRSTTSTSTCSTSRPLS